MEAHWVEQDAIGACMASEGFDYIPVPFVERESVSSEQVVLLPDSTSTEGYGVTSMLLRRWFLPTGAPPDSFSEAEVAAYNAALLGSGDDHEHIGGHSDHQHSDHQHGDEPDHQHGCRSVGLAAREQLAPVEDLEEWQQANPDEFLDRFHEELWASDSYSSFRTAWIACMSDEGHEVNDPLSQWQTVLGEQAGKLQLLLDSDSDLMEKIEEYVRSSGMEDGSFSIDETWMESLFGISPELSALLRDEIRIAEADADCRDQNSELIVSEIADLESRILSG